MAEALEQKVWTKFSARKLRVVVGFVAAMLIAGCVVLGMVGWLEASQVIWRTTLVVVLAGGGCWAGERYLPRAQRVKPEQMWWVGLATGLVPMLLVSAIAGIVFYGTPISGVLTGQWLVVPLMVGILLTVMGVGRRVGDSQHCPKCEYEFVFAEEAQQPIRCPECGTGWLGRLRKGRRVRSPRLIAIGASIAICGVLAFSTTFWLGAVAPYLPTVALYAAVYADPSPMSSEWQELAARPLSDGELRFMSESLLDERRWKRGLSTTSVWFEALINAGKMPVDLKERYFREGFRAEVTAPARAKVGEPFDVALRVRHVAHSSGIQIGIYFAGYAVDGAAPVGRRETVQWAFELSPRGFAAFSDRLSEKLVLVQAGPVKVRAVYWVVFQPSFWEHPVWQPDGTPVRPAPAIWFERVERETTVVGE